MRPEKASVVLDLTEKLKRSPFVLVTDYQRMKVGDFSELRNRLAPAGAEVHVVKNNLLKRAMTDSGFPEANETLNGQTAVVTGDKDVAPVAKIFKTFAAEFKVAALKIGFVFFFQAEDGIRDADVTGVQTCALPIYRRVRRRRRRARLRAARSRRADTTARWEAGRCGCEHPRRGPEPRGGRRRRRRRRPQDRKSVV